MLPDSMLESRLYGVELDSITGRIAQKLYPQAEIKVAGFETTDRRDFYDLAVGNVPFGNYRVSDKPYDKLGFSIHNYFFAKALDQVRPGGIVAFVTSRYTMDSKNPDARKYLAQRAELLGAIRLPNNAFRANAGTDVVSDIIFLQKRDHPIDIEPDWVHVQLTEDLETRFMAAVKRMKQAFNLCSSSDAISDREKDYLHFYCAVRSILFKLTKGDAPDISQMNARVRELLEGAIQSDGIEELFETGKHISVDIFSDEYLDKINAIQLPNTKIKVLQRLLSQAIDEYKKVNRIMGMEFSDRLKRVVDEYNNRRRDEAFANEVLDDVAEQLAKLLEELKKEKDSFKGMGIDYEEKAFYDILKAVAKKYEFEYPDDKMIELSKRIKVIVDDKAKYTDWSTRDDIKANLQVDLILLLDEFDYPPVTIDDVYKEVLEQAENFKKYSE